MVNLIQALQEKAASIPQKTAFIHLGRDGHERGSISFKELDELARSAACYLNQFDLSGKPLIILLKTRIKFIVCFFGCIYAGILPVPMPVPRYGKSWARLRAVAGSSGATHILSDRKTIGRLDQASRPNGIDESNYIWLAAEDVISEKTSRWQMPDFGHDNIAFLQYTSGSTGNPKGVIISHGNLLENTRDFSKHFGLSQESVSVSWLPLFHDMGLVAHVVQPMVLGCTAVLLDPHSFIMKPLSWLRAVTDYRGNFSGAPNFAYELCVRQIPEKENTGLDLSSWETAYSGAEPVRNATLKRFYARFKKAGFRRRSFYPVYGLSEATLMVSGKQAGDTYSTLGMADIIRTALNGHIFVQKELVSCGAATGRQRIKVVDPVSKILLDEGQIGEIWISGKNIAGGYWQNSEDTRRFFVEDPRDGRVWFRTGDLGFFKAAHLYIAGRIKDILIINGENYSAEDMEYAIALCHPGFAIGGCALFSIDTETGEQPVAACEIARNTDVKTRRSMVTMACETVSADYGIPLYDFVFTGPGKLPRTTSGKIQRHICRQRYMEKDPDASFNRVAHPCLVRNRMEATDG